MSASMERHEWLEASHKALIEKFAGHGYKVPKNVRVSVGFPKLHGRSKAIGECWSSENSADKHFEIFVSPTLEDSETILGVVAHELGHATVGHACGHRGEFKTCALAIGLTGKMTATVPGPEFKKWSDRFLTDQGPYPAGKINMNGRKKKQTYLVKCECPDCGYIVRTTEKWLWYGAPICPCNNEPMSIG